MPTQDNRRTDLDIARAIAVSLVVLHHIVQYFPRFGVSLRFSGDVTYVVTYIHISIFILIAGILIGLNRQKVTTIAEYRQFEGKKFLRLMVPFFSMSILQLLIKISSPSFGLGQAGAIVTATLVAPHSGGGMPHGWFLYMLMTIFLLWPMLRPLADSKALLPLLGVLIALAIFPINWPLYKGPANTAPYFELHRTTWYFPIFVIGYWYGRNKFGRENPRAIAPILTGFIFLAAIAAHRFVPWPGGVAWTTLSRSVRWIGYLAAGFCVVWFCSLWGRKQGRIQSWLANVGFYSYDIYLFHVIVGHAVVLVLIKSGIAAAAGWLIVPVAIALTIFISWVIGYFIRRLPKLAFVMLGVPLKRRPRPAKAPAEQARIK